MTTFAVPGASATLAGGINDRGRITTIDLPGFASTAVTDINNRGQLVGQTGDAAGQGLGFVRDPNGRLAIIELPGPAGVQEILALNDRGQVTGTYNNPNAAPGPPPATAPPMAPMG